MYDMVNTFNAYDVDKVCRRGGVYIELLAK